MYKVCSREISILISCIYGKEFPHLGELQIAYLLIIIKRNTLNCAKLAIDANLFKSLYEVVNIEKYLLVEGINNKEIYVEVIMKEYGRFLIEMNIKNIPNFFFSLEEWRAIATLSAKHYNENELAQKAINYVVSTLEVVKNQIEESRTTEHRENYEELRKYLKYLSSLLGNSKESQEIKARLKSMVDSFKKIKPGKGSGPTW